MTVMVMIMMMGMLMMMMMMVMIMMMMMMMTMTVVVVREHRIFPTSLRLRHHRPKDCSDGRGLPFNEFGILSGRGKIYELNLTLQLKRLFIRIEKMCPHVIHAQPVDAARERANVRSPPSRQYLQTRRRKGRERGEKKRRGDRIWSLRHAQTRGEMIIRPGRGKKQCAFRG